MSSIDMYKQQKKLQKQKMISCDAFYRQTDNMIQTATDVCFTSITETIYTHIQLIVHNFCNYCINPFVKLLTY